MKSVHLFPFLLLILGAAVAISSFIGGFGDSGPLPAAFISLPLILSGAALLFSPIGGIFIFLSGMAYITNSALSNSEFSVFLTAIFFIFFVGGVIFSVIEGILRMTSKISTGIELND